LRLEKGDALLLVTDGITEARRDGTLLGYEGMTRIARRALREHASLRDAGRSLLNETRAFAGGTLQDDACIVIARRQ
jgi:serine phosphatase RsbU (regulator of sigma subunit)